MKLNNKYLIVSFLFMTLSFSIAMSAQEGLCINSIFKKYGKQKGATMVVLSGKAIKEYKLNTYKSITVNYDKAVFNEIQNCIEEDKKGASKIKEVINNGIVSSGYYKLLNTNEINNEYILFKVGDNHKATIIYMEGGIESERLIESLFIKQK